jgi:hypothetical protein
MGYEHTHLSAITAAADVDRFITSTDMKRGTYGAVGAAGVMPELNTARKVTISLTRQDAVDAPLGTVTIVGTDINGVAQTEIMTPVDNTTATSTKWFKTVTSVTGGTTWVTAGAADLITVGCGATAIVAAGSGTIHAIAVNTTAAGAITVADANGTIAVLVLSIPEGLYEIDANYSGYLAVTLAGASDITVLCTASLPTSYSM